MLRETGSPNGQGSVQSTPLSIAQPRSLCLGYPAWLLRMKIQSPAAKRAATSIHGLPPSAIEVVLAWSRTHVTVNLGRPGGQIIRKVASVLAIDRPLRRILDGWVSLPNSAGELALSLDLLRWWRGQAWPSRSSSIGPFGRGEDAVRAHDALVTILARIWRSWLQRGASRSPGPQEEVQVLALGRGHRPDRSPLQVHFIPPHVLPWTRRGL